MTASSGTSRRTSGSCGVGATSKKRHSAGRRVAPVPVLDLFLPLHEDHGLLHSLRQNTLKKVSMLRNIITQEALVP